MRRENYSDIFDENSSSKIFFRAANSFDKRFFKKRDGVLFLFAVILRVADKLPCDRLRWLPFLVMLTVVLRIQILVFLLCSINLFESLHQKKQLSCVSWLTKRNV